MLFGLDLVLQALEQEVSLLSNIPPVGVCSGSLSWLASALNVLPGKEAASVTWGPGVALIQDICRIHGRESVQQNRKEGMLWL